MCLAAVFVNHCVMVNAVLCVVVCGCVMCRVVFAFSCQICVWLVCDSMCDAVWPVLCVFVFSCVLFLLLYVFACFD